jgi:AcrR family transcriptional regulator
MLVPLTRERIVATAIAVADRDGFAAVTLRRVAADLGVHVTSLYNHVPTGDGIVDGMVERLLEEADLPSEAVGWEEWVRRFVDGIGGIAERHPGAFTALQRRPVQGARANASFEIALAAFARAGLAPDDAYGAVKTTTFVALSISVERALSSGGDVAETDVDALPVDEFPHFHGLASIDRSEEAVWSFALETLLSGLRAQVRRRKSIARAR